MTLEQQTARALQRAVLRRALNAGDGGRLILRFDAHVVDRYRERGARVIRTRSVGRISFPGRWSLDVGITPADAEVQLPFKDLLERLPEEERDHWLDHLVVEPASMTFLRMQAAGAACIDDGDAEAWN